MPNDGINSDWEKPNGFSQSVIPDVSLVGCDMNEIALREEVP
jgi:hypothetical protein